MGSGDIHIGSGYWPGPSGALPPSLVTARASDLTDTVEATMALTIPAPTISVLPDSAAAGEEVSVQVTYGGLDTLYLTTVYGTLSLDHWTGTGTVLTRTVTYT